LGKGGFETRPYDCKERKDDQKLFPSGMRLAAKYDDLYDENPPNSRRIDIPKDMLPPSSRLAEGRRYFDFSEPKYSDMTPIYELAKEFMKGREGK
jgi:hypothetical protein